MIDFRSGTRVWIAAGVTDMRRGFYGLSAQVQTVLNAQPDPATCLCFAAGAATKSSCYGSMATVFVCSRSD